MSQPPLRLRFIGPAAVLGVGPNAPGEEFLHPEGVPGLLRQHRRVVFDLAGG